MRNNRPKSESAAVKEHAAEDKVRIARQLTTAAEKTAAHPHRPSKPRRDTPKEGRK